MRSPSLLPVPVLRGLAAAVLGASLWCGVRALARDYDRAFHVAGHSVFPESVVHQIDAIRRAVPPGQSILLLSESHDDGAWYTRLFQRALYPRNRVVVRYQPLGAALFARDRKDWAIGWGLLLAPEASALPLDRPVDLGTLPAMPDRVWLAPLKP